MQDEACKYWDLSKLYKYWLKHGGHYATTLACALSKLNITCPCHASEEIVPVVSHKNIELHDSKRDVKKARKHLSITKSSECKISVDKVLAS